MPKLHFSPLQFPGKAGHGTMQRSLGGTKAALPEFFHLLHFTLFWEAGRPWWWEPQRRFFFYIRLQPGQKFLHKASHRHNFEQPLVFSQLHLGVALGSKNKLNSYFNFQSPNTDCHITKSDTMGYTYVLQSTTWWELCVCWYSYT